MCKDECIVGIDAGNSTVRVALLRSGCIEYNGAVSTHPLDGLYGRLERIAPEFAGVNQSVISSVCSGANRALEKFSGRLHAGREAVFLTRGHVPLRISAEVAEPDRVGIDRLLCGYAAARLYGFPCVVVGAGTAVTVDFIGDSGEFKGGAIGPGFRIASRALSRWTSSLPDVVPEVHSAACGRNTVEALQIGIYYFCRGGVELLADKMLAGSDRRGEAQVILTGGDAGLLGEPDFSVGHIFDLDLLLKGIWLAWEEGILGKRTLRCFDSAATGRGCR